MDHILTVVWRNNELVEARLKSEEQVGGCRHNPGETFSRLGWDNDGTNGQVGGRTEVIFWRRTWIYLGNNQVQSVHAYIGPFDSPNVNSRGKTLPAPCAQICVFKVVLATYFTLGKLKEGHGLPVLQEAHPLISSSFWKL